MTNKILYIDSVNSIDSIRPAEKAVYVNYLPKYGFNINYYLRNQLILNTNTMSLNMTDLTIHVLNKIYDFLVIRNNINLGFYFLVLSKFINTKVIFIHAFPRYDLSIEIISKQKSVLRRLKIKIKTIKKYFYFLFLRKFDLIVTRSEYSKNYLIQRKIKSSKIYSYPMGFDFSQPIANDITQLKKNLKISFENFIIYYGAMDEGRRIEFVLDAISEIRYDIFNIKFLFVGGTTKEIDKLKKYCKQKDISDLIFFTGYLEKMDALLLLKEALFSISFIPPIDAYIYSSPTKVVESLGVGTPVIVNSEILDQHFIIKESNGGISIPYNKPALIATISSMTKNEKKLNELGENAKKYIYKHRNYEKMTENYYEKLLEIL